VIIRLFAFFAIVFSITAASTTGIYSISNDYAIKFETRGAEGTFSNLDGTIVFDVDQLDHALFDVYVETATIETGNKTQNKHARGQKWLNASDYPKISFKSSTFTKTSSGYLVVGEFSIRGISKEVSIPFTYDERVFTGNVTIDRNDFNVEGPSLFGSLVGNEIEVSLRVALK